MKLFSKTLLFAPLIVLSLAANAQITVTDYNLPDSTISCAITDAFTTAEQIVADYVMFSGNVSTACEGSDVFWFEMSDPSVYDTYCGEVTFDYELNDDCGSQDFVSVTITILDTVPPTYIGGISTDLTVQCEEYYSDLNTWISEIEMSFTDDCLLDPTLLLVTNDCNGCTLECNSSLTVNFYADDGCGNVDTVPFTITVLNDTDLDGIDNDMDNCPDTPNSDQADEDDDGIGDVCDPINDLDVDGDDVLIDVDNCPTIYNPGQEDKDDDGIGDVCDDLNDIDFDEDGILNEDDNCPNTVNPLQADKDMDGLGDVCDTVNDIDFDEDGILNGDDNCPNTINPGQEDIDNDGKGNLCDDLNELSPFVTISENIYLEKSYTGIILKAQNGTCWIITVNNDGSLATLSVECPQ